MIPISEIKETLKEILPEGLKGIVRNTLPSSVEQLPAIVISSLEYQEAPVGIGDIIGTARQDTIDTGTVKGTRVMGSILFDLWDQKSGDIENRANEIMAVIDTQKIGLRKKGFLKIALSQIKPAEIIKKNGLWSGNQDVWRKGLDYQMIYEKVFTEESDEVISQIKVDIDSEYKEKIVIGKTIFGLVPDLLNMGKDEALSILTEAGFVPGEITQQESVQPTDTVIGQNPLPGTKVLLKSPINLSLSKQTILLTQNAQAGGSGADKPGMMLDGSLDRNKYASHNWNKPNTYLLITLAQMSWVSKIKTLLWDKDNRFYRYKIELSTDEENWVLVVDKTAGEHRSWQTDVFEPVRAKYIKTTGTFNSSNSWFHVVEQEVYGTVD